MLLPDVVGPPPAAAPAQGEVVRSAVAGAPGSGPEGARRVQATHALAIALGVGPLLHGHGVQVVDAAGFSDVPL